MISLAYNSSMLHPLVFLFEREPVNKIYSFRLAKIYSNIRYRKKEALREIFQAIIGFQFQLLRDTIREII